MPSPTPEEASLSDLPGVRVGNWTDPVGRTGCTVLLFPSGTVASGEVRGGAPATREWALLAPERRVARLDAVALCGGSSFGLAACDGVMRYCEERGMGVPTSVGPVPIVVGAALFDLGVGDPGARPGAEEGYRACQVAARAALDQGQVGAGTGARVGKWRGASQARAGGLGWAGVREGELVVSAVMVVNAFGDPVVAETKALANRGASALSWLPSGDLAGTDLAHPPFGESTTIGVVATNARLNKLECLLVAQSAHDGLARAIFPAHTLADGDAVVAAATGPIEAPVGVVGALAAAAVAAAVVRATGQAGAER